MNAEQRARRRAEQVATAVGGLIAAVGFVGSPLLAAALGIPREFSFAFVVGVVMAGLAIVIAAPFINRREIRALRRSLARQHPDSDVRLVFFTEPEGFRRIAVLVISPDSLTLNVRDETEPRLAVGWDAVSGAHADSMPRGNSAILVVDLDGTVDQRLVVLANNSLLPRRAPVVYQLAADINARARSTGELPKPAPPAHAKVARIMPLPARIVIHALSAIVVIAAGLGASVLRHDPVIESTLMNIVVLIVVVNFWVILHTSDSARAARLGW